MSVLTGVPAATSAPARKCGEAKSSRRSVCTLHSIVVSYSGSVAVTADRSLSLSMAVRASSSEAPVPAAISAADTSAAAVTKALRVASAEANAGTLFSV